MLSCPPILFLIFSHPHLPRRVCERIREARPAQLFVAADGPRAERPGEAGLCAATRRVVDQVDWPRVFVPITVVGGDFYGTGARICQVEAPSL